MSFVKYESYGQFMETLLNSMKYLAYLFEENSNTYEEYISKNNNLDIYKSSEKLGKSGWVSPFCLDNLFIEYDCDAIQLAKTDLCKFENECIERKLVIFVLKEIDKLNCLNSNMYYQKAKESMSIEDYFGVALSLLPLLEYVVSKIVVCDNQIIKNKEKYSERKFKEIYNKIFNIEIRDRYSKDFFILEVFPSLYSYMNLLFCCTPEEWKEANTFKRDLLMHGRSKYVIKEIDCIRLFNAIYVVSFIVKTLKLDSIKC